MKGDGSLELIPCIRSAGTLGLLHMILGGSLLRRYVMVHFSNGRAGKTVLKILDGSPDNETPTTANDYKMPALHPTAMCNSCLGVSVIISRHLVSYTPFFH